MTRPTATEQEIFDRVATHLLAQGRQAREPNDIGMCRYLMENGDRCAIGCLFTRTPEADEKALLQVGTVEAPSGALDLLDFEPSYDQIHILRRLQRLHDQVDPGHWALCLETLAEEYGLSAAVLAGDSR